MEDHNRKDEESLFSFGIISDTHCRPEQGDESSPWEVNKLANDRARWIIEQLNAEKLDFVIHMGDIVHPLPHLSSYDLAAENSLKIFEKSKAHFYYLPGNHDVGDKHNQTMPAYLVDDFGLDQYTKWFGPLYQSFDHKGVHFVLINSPSLNSGHAHEVELKRWIETDLDEHNGERIYVFSHYPPYIVEPNEPSNYDNIDEPARSWLLKLLERYGVEAFFSGHVHQFIYQEHGVTDCYNLFATSFVRQDYSEMFKIEAADDYGRNDIEKLGWCIVEVYKDEHITRIFRSGGSTLKKGEPLSTRPRKISTPHTKKRLAQIGVHLRHPWAEIIDLPYNGPIDEFHRKRVRNDYTILGLWECGIPDIRVPISDLLDEKIRLRMKALRKTGLRFNVFCIGTPKVKEIEMIKAHQNVLDILEIILPWRDAEKYVRELTKLKKTISIPIFLANVMSSGDQRSQGSKFSHYMSFGFHHDNTESVETFLNLDSSREIADGFVFRIAENDSVWNSMRALTQYSKEKKINVIANVRLASENPAKYLNNDNWVANRTAEALIAASVTPNVQVYLDTFMDLDRGYFPRIGLYDRRYNRRLASYVLANLQGALFDYGPITTLRECVENTEGKTLVFESKKNYFYLILPQQGKTPKIEFALPSEGYLITKKKVKLVDLASGIIFESNSETTNDNMVLSAPNYCKTPSLIIIEKSV